MKEGASALTELPAAWARVVGILFAPLKAVKDQGHLLDDWCEETDARQEEGNQRSRRAKQGMWRRSIADCDVGDVRQLISVPQVGGSTDTDSSSSEEFIYAREAAKQIEIAHVLLG